MDKKEILTQALVGRIDEVVQYQVNIDNFKRAIERAKDDPDLVDFVSNLGEMLASSILEQKKSQIMLEVIQEQVEEMQ